MKRTGTVTKPAIVRCFLMEATSVYTRFLKRWTTPSMQCPASRQGYHIGAVPIGTVRASQVQNGDVWDHADSRWPSLCDCGYIFEPVDYWAVHHQQLFVRPDTGFVSSLADAPAGAVWSVEPATYPGPDGKSIAVKTPAGDWFLDHPAKDGTRWTRRGEPPRLDVSPACKLGNYIATLHGGLLIPWE